MLLAIMQIGKNVTLKIFEKTWLFSYKSILNNKYNALILSQYFNALKIGMPYTFLESHKNVTNNNNTPSNLII